MARQVRVGLEEVETPVVESKPVTKQISDPLDELYYRKPLRIHVREFGAVLALVFSIIAGFKLYKHGELALSAVGWWLGAAVLALALCIYAPRLMLPVWRVWMKFAHMLGGVVTFILLSLMWCSLFIPISGILRVLRIKVMDTTFDRSAKTYWEERDEKHSDFKLLERQF